MPKNKPKKAVKEPISHVKNFISFKYKKEYLKTKIPYSIEQKGISIIIYPD